ncbi:phenylalanine--tRNA ligase subunit beta, partial [candidate division KSB1 bacterium]
MLLSLNWLKQYIDLPKNLAPKQLADDLTMATVEVESVKNMAEDFEKIVVGKVVKLEKHPNADKLKLAYVDIGYENIKTLKHKDKLVKIVCGGTNLYEGMLAAVALPGAKVKWHGQGEPVVLEKAKIRGEESFGMICASNEIGLQDMFPCGKMEVTDLSKVEGIKIGQPLSQALGLDDVVVEIENKSLTNRPDLWNHYGMARELAAIYKTKLKELNLFDKFKTQNSKLEIKISNKKLCSRYIGCVVNNVKIKKSPEWLIKRLEAVGMRAINNIVDITNYVMLDVGEPMHAFDKSKIQNPKIIVRTAKKGEKIKTLDGELRQLDETMLVIADAEKPIAVAGIMGGANSEVDEKTQSIVLEAATFDPISVRKTAQKLGLRTEASIRFEKNLDPNLAELGMRRALKLIKEILPEAEIGPMVDVDYSSKKRIAIKVEHEFLEKRVGQKLDTRVVVDVLERLGFVVKTQNTIPSTRDKAQESVLYNILVPTWRATGDVSIPEDIVEEVARIYGYDNLKEKIEMAEMRKAVYQREFEIEKKVKDYLSLGCGMNEVFNYPWTEEGVLKNLGFLDPN